MTNTPTPKPDYKQQNIAYKKRIENAQKLQKIFPDNKKGINTIAEDDELTQEVLKSFGEIRDLLPGNPKEREEKAIQIVKVLVDLRASEEEDMTQRMSEAAILMKGGIETVKAALQKMHRADIAQIIGFNPPKEEASLDSKTIDIMDRAINGFFKNKVRTRAVLVSTLGLSNEEDIDTQSLNTFIGEQAHVHNFYNRKSKILDHMISGLSNQDKDKKFPTSEEVLNILFDNYIFPKSMAA